MAAVTAVEPDPDNPEWGHQQLTAVTRPHRGHRLGLLVKTAMLDWLAEAEPRLERIVTENAAVNQHMIAINEELGYELLEPLAQSYEVAVADLPGADVPGAARRPPAAVAGPENESRRAGRARLGGRHGHRATGRNRPGRDPGVS